MKHGSGNAEPISFFFTKDSPRLFSLLLIDACPKFHSFALHLFSFHYLLDPIDYPLNCHIPFSCWFPPHFSDWLLLPHYRLFKVIYLIVTERMRFGIWRFSPWEIHNLEPVTIGLVHNSPPWVVRKMRNSYTYVKLEHNNKSKNDSYYCHSIKLMHLTCLFLKLGAVRLFGYKWQPSPGFPRGSVVKNSLANAGDTGSILSPVRSPAEGNLLQYSCLRNPTDGGAWRATVHGVTKESDTT